MTDLKAALYEILPSIAERERANPETFPAESMTVLFDAGVIAAPFPSELGGRNASLAETVEAVESIAAASGSVALLASMPMGLAGVLGLGSGVAPEEHRSAYAAQIARIAEDYRKRRLYAALNSEKGAGGSLAATQTQANRRADGSFAIDGEKILGSSGRNAATFFSTAKVKPDELPGAGVVEFFLVDATATGVEILDDWDGFGMRSTESHYASATAREMLGFPNFIQSVQPLQYWFCLFAAIPLGCARAMLRAAGSPAPRSPAMRVRLSEAVMRYESLRAYLLETARDYRAAAGPEYAARVLRTKTFVSHEATKLCADLFAHGGGRNYRRTSPVARAFADSFAGTALRPPLALGLDMLVENFSLGGAET